MQLQRFHGPKNPMVSRLLASDPMTEYQRSLSKWLDESGDGDPISRPAALTLVQHADGTINGQINSASSYRAALLALLGKSDGAAITVIDPGEQLAGVRKRLDDLDRET